MSSTMASVSLPSSPTGKYVPPHIRQRAHTLENTSSFDKQASKAPTATMSDKRRMAAMNPQAPTFTPGGTRYVIPPSQVETGAYTHYRYQARSPSPAASSQAASRRQGLACEDLAPGHIVFIPAQSDHRGSWLTRPTRANNTVNMPYSHPAIITEVLAHGKVRLHSITSLNQSTLNDKYPKAHNTKERSRYRFIHHPTAVGYEHPDGYPSLRMKATPSTRSLVKPSYINIEDTVECGKDCLQWFKDNGEQKGMAVDPTDLHILDPSYVPTSLAWAAALPAPSATSWVAKSRAQGTLPVSAPESGPVWNEVLTRQAKQVHRVVKTQASNGNAPRCLAPSARIGQNIFSLLPSA